MRRGMTNKEGMTMVDHIEPFESVGLVEEYAFMRIKFMCFCPSMIINHVKLFECN